MRGPLAAGSRVFILTARSRPEIYAALDRLTPNAKSSVTVLSFATNEALVPERVAVMVKLAEKIKRWFYGIGTLAPPLRFQYRKPEIVDRHVLSRAGQ